MVSLICMSKCIRKLLTLWRVDLRFDCHFYLLFCGTQFICQSCSGQAMPHEKAGEEDKFRIDYEQTKDMVPGEAILSDAFSAGGHTWRLDCYPYGEWGQ